MTKKVPDWTTADSFAALKRIKPLFPDYLSDLCGVCDTWVLYARGELPVHPLCADTYVRQQRKKPDPNQGSLGI